MPPQEHHAQGLRPVRQRGVEQVVRAGPDVEEDQAPEVHHRKAVGIDRPLRLLGHEVIHDAQETGGQEEADRVVAVPPLGQRVLDAGEQRIGLDPERADRHGERVDHVKQGDGDDERQEEPVGDVDVRLPPPPQRAQEHQQVDHPDDGQPDVHVPLGLGVFLGLGDAQDVAGRGEDDEQLIAPEHEPGRPVPGQARAAGPLDHVERAHDQHVAAEGEDHRRGVQRPETPEGGPRQIEVEHRKGQLQGQHQADQEADHAPEGRGDHPGPDDGVVVDRRAPVGGHGGHNRGGAGLAPDHPEPGQHAGDQEDQAVDVHARVDRLRRQD